MKIYQIKVNHEENEIISIDTFGNKNPIVDADKIFKLLTNDISSKAFSIVIRKLKCGGYIKCK